jgi:GNAT superfamily N-acetyltransferase
MSQITIRPMRDEHLDALSGLLHAQKVRQYTLDPRLVEAGTQQQSLASLAHQPRGSEHALVALDAHGRVRGCAIPDIWELSESSILCAFLSARNGVARLLALPDPAEEEAAAVAMALLTALSEVWQRLGTTGEIVRWPSADSYWFEPILIAQGFQLDSICALRSLSPLAEATHISSPGLVTRHALPTDEEVLVALLEEELRYHERFTPFVCSSPAVLTSFRRKLAQLWSGASLEEGAPLILVVEQAGEVGAMAENTLLVLGPDDEPGFTPPGRYGCIDNVCVREERRGQGIGRLLVQAIFDAFAATELQIDRYILWYNPDNPQAGRFWPYMGFVPLWTTYQRLHAVSGMESKTRCARAEN